MPDSVELTVVQSSEVVSATVDVTTEDITVSVSSEVGPQGIQGIQ